MWKVRKHTKNRANLKRMEWWHMGAQVRVQQRFVHILWCFMMFYVLRYCFYVFLWYVDISMVLLIFCFILFILSFAVLLCSSMVRPLLCFITQWSPWWSECNESVFKQFLRYFNLESLQNTGLNMPHKVCFGHLRALDGAIFSTINFVDSPYLVVFNDLCFVFCSGQPFWVPWTCILLCIWGHSPGWICIL